MAITYGTSSGDAYWDIRGLSSDVKPVDGIPNGSTFYEADTVEVYMFDSDSQTWKLQ